MERNSIYDGELEFIQKRRNVMVGFEQSQGDLPRTMRSPTSSSPPPPLIDIQVLDETDDDAHSWPWLKWFEAFLIRVGFVVIFYLIILLLQQYEILEPCAWKISYYRSCKVDTYIPYFNLLTYTTYHEDYICVVPGTTFHQSEEGWNMNYKCDN